MPGNSKQFAMNKDPNLNPWSHVGALYTASRGNSYYLAINEKWGGQVAAHLAKCTRYRAQSPCKGPQFKQGVHLTRGEVVKQDFQADTGHTKASQRKQFLIYASNPSWTCVHHRLDSKQRKKKTAFCTQQQLNRRKGMGTSSIVWLLSFCYLFSSLFLFSLYIYY